MSEDKVILPPPRLQFLVPETGLPAAGYKIFVYEAGTTTKAESWTGADGVTNNTNPIVLDANGECDLWVLPMLPEEVEPNPPGPPGPVGPVGPPGPPGPTGNTAEFSNSVDILSTTIYNGFHNQYIEIVPNPDPTVFLVPVLVVIGYKYVTTPYQAGGGNFVVSWGPPLSPTAVPFGTFSGVLLEQVTDQVLCIPGSPMNGSRTALTGTVGVPLTLSFDGVITGAGLIGVAISTAGTGYATGDTGTIGGGNATYEIAAETAGVPTDVTLTYGGTGYSDGTAQATATGGSQPGVGTGLTLDTYSAETVSGTLRVTTYFRRFTPQ